MLKALRIFGQIFFIRISLPNPWTCSLSHRIIPVPTSQIILYHIAYHTISYHIISYCITLVFYFVSYHILLYCTILHYTTVCLYCIRIISCIYTHSGTFNGSFILRHLRAKQLRKKPEAVAPWFNERVKSSEIGIVMDLSTLTQCLNLCDSLVMWSWCLLKETLSNGCYLIPWLSTSSYKCFLTNNIDFILVILLP